MAIGGSIHVIVRRINMVETIVYEIWVAGRFGEIIHRGKLSFEKVLTRVNLACINLPVVNIHLESDRDAGRAPPFPLSISDS